MSVGIRKAVEAHTTLCLFENIATMLESSDIKGERARRAAGKAISILRREQQYLLQDYDDALRPTSEDQKRDAP